MQTRPMVCGMRKNSVPQRRARRRRRSTGRGSCQLFMMVEMASARKRRNNPIAEPLRIAVTTTMGWQVFHGCVQYAYKLHHLGRMDNNWQKQGGYSPTRERCQCISAPSTLVCTWTSSPIGIFGNTAATADWPEWMMSRLMIMAGKTPTHGNC